MKRLLVLFVCFGVFGSAAVIGPPPKVYYASQAGATLDCVVSTGLTAASGTCTDNTAILNAVLALATASNPVELVIDGGTAACGVTGPAAGYWTLRGTGWGSGIFVKNSCNGYAVQNLPGACPYNGAGSPGTAGNAIAVADMMINGNRANNSTNANKRYCANGATWIVGLYLDNMSHVLVDHVWFYDTATYAVLLNACADCIVTNSRIEQPSDQFNQDGVHVDGPSAQIRVDHNWFYTADDSIAINASEGYGGTIDGVAMDDNQCVGCTSAGRLLANEPGENTNSAVKHVVITNSGGTLTYGPAQDVVWAIGFPCSGCTKTADIISDVSISNCSYGPVNQYDSTEQFILVSDNVGTLSLSNVHWVNPASTNPFIAFGDAAVVSNLVIADSGIHRTTLGSAAAPLAVIPSGDTVKRMELNGFAVTNETGQTYAALGWLMDVQSGGAIGTLVLDAVDPALSPTLLNGNEWSRITSFYGAGVSAYYRSTTYANLPPATYSGLTASITDGTSVVWGATEAGSGSDYAQLTSDGVNWTVTGK